MSEWTARTIEQGCATGCSKIPSMIEREKTETEAETERVIIILIGPGKQLQELNTFDADFD